MPTGREDRRRGKLLPSPVTPSETVCFTITIPSATQYRAALLGVIGQLSQWYTWDHPLDGTECDDCDEAAQLWAVALSGATFSDECGVDMSCEDVADCIETSEAVQTALATQIANNVSVQNATYNTSNIGAPLTDAQAAASLTVAADCDLNALFGSITAIVNQIDANNRSFLAQLEVETNKFERLRDLVAAIPLFETLPVDDALNFVDTSIEQIKEYYEAAATTGLIDTYRCALFCAAKDRPDCAMSFDILVSYFEDRLGASFSNEQLFIDMVGFFVTGTWSGPQVVDAISLAQVVVWREASNFMGVSFRTLQQVGALGANDDDADWEILCEDCPAPSENCNDLTIAAGNLLSPEPGYTVFIEGTGLRAVYSGPPYSNWYDRINMPNNRLFGSFKKVSLRFTETAPSMKLQVGATQMGIGTVVGDTITWEGTTGNWPITNADTGTAWIFYGAGMDGVGGDSVVYGQVTAIELCWEEA